MAVYEVRVDGNARGGAMDAATADSVYADAIEEGSFDRNVELCKVIIIESVEHGLVVKKRRGRKAKKHVM